MCTLLYCATLLYVCTLLLIENPKMKNLLGQYGSFIHVEIYVVLYLFLSFMNINKNIEFFYPSFIKLIIYILIISY